MVWLISMPVDQVPRTCTSMPNTWKSRALFSPLSQATGVFTGVQNGDLSSTPLIGQASHTFGTDTARLTFLAPDELIELPAVEEVIEFLLKRLGEREAQTLLAEVDESSVAFEVLRRHGFRGRRSRAPSLARIRGLDATA